MPRDHVPTPRLVAAWLVVGGLATESVPLWAAHWLAQGRDGEALRELAGLHGDDAHAVRDLLPAALAEAGESLHESSEGAVLAASKEASMAIAYSDIANLFLSDRASARWVLDKVHEVVVDDNYGDLSLAQPLGRLWGLDDEWDAGWGRTDDVLTAEVRRGCEEQLRTAPDA